MPFPPVDISVLAEKHLADVGIAGLGGKVESGPDIISEKFTILHKCFFHEMQKNRTFILLLKSSIFS